MVLSSQNKGQHVLFHQGPFSHPCIDVIKATGLSHLSFAIAGESWYLRRLLQRKFVIYAFIMPVICL